MDTKTRGRLVLGLLIAAGAVGAYFFVGEVKAWVDSVLGKVTGKEGPSSTTAPKPTAEEVALVRGKFIDPSPGGSASVAAGGNTYPIVVQVWSELAGTTGTVRVRVTEEPLIDKAQTFDFSWPNVKIPAGGQAITLKDDMPSMALIDAPISALFGRAALGNLYFEDQLIAVCPFTVGAKFT